ncbi:MAG: membrane protease YdiL (CAAX protease family) [Rhodothermales bacterium]|jgi:membrane protease YdiL (CAAX protease family)
MRPLAFVILYFSGVFTLGALLAPPLYAGFMAVTDSGIFTSFADTPFRRVANRSFLLVAIAGLPLLVRALAVRSKAKWGYGNDRGEWVACALGGLSFGLLTMTLLVLLEYTLGILAWDDRRDTMDLVTALLGGLVSGIFVAFVEETFFRGILFSAFRRHGLRAAILLPALLYAGCHFISSRGDYSAITWTSGFEVLAGSFWQFKLVHLGPFLALLAIGIFLGMLREQSGHIGWVIGIHCGWVAVIRLGRKATSSNPDSSLGWLASGYDSITGYLSLFYLLVMIVALHLYQKRQAQAAFEDLPEDVAELG